jgi:hypothetical protein
MASVKVWPRDENVRRLLKHPFGMRFRETLNDGVEWPDDLFTKRRIKDGSVLTKAPSATASPTQAAAPVGAKSK